MESVLSINSMIAEKATMNDEDEDVEDPSDILILMRKKSSRRSASLSREERFPTSTRTPIGFYNVINIRNCVSDQFSLSADSVNSAVTEDTCVAKVVGDASPSTIIVRTNTDLLSVRFGCPPVLIS